MKSWEELTRQERKEVMKNYRAEWISDLEYEIRDTPDGEDRNGLIETLNNLTRSESPAIVYDCVVDEFPEDLIRYYAVNG